MRALGFAIVIMGGVGIAACGSAPGSHPGTADAEHGQGGKSAQSCQPSEPLSALAFDSEALGDLEVAMRDGVVVVHFDCQGPRLLSSCQAPGAYRFEPASSAAAATESNKVVVGDAIFELSLAVSGRQQAETGALTRAQLKGACDGATHVVRAVDVGAFVARRSAERTEGVAVAVAGAEVGASSSSAHAAERRVGDLAACRANSADDPAAVRCRAPVALHLEPVH